MALSGWILEDQVEQDLPFGDGLQEHLFGFVSIFFLLLFVK